MQVWDSDLGIRFWMQVLVSGLEFMVLYSGLRFRYKIQVRD